MALTEKEADIDELVPKVEKAMQAYQICKDRRRRFRRRWGSTLRSTNRSVALNLGANDDGEVWKPKPSTRKPETKQLVSLSPS